MSGSSPSRAPRDIDHAVVRFAGDSGDGMQLTGTEFTREAAFQGNDLATFPDYPAEIRAPAGTTAGVSGYQIQFAAHEVFSAGAQPDTLVAMNPAALKVHLNDLKKSGLLVVNEASFTPADLARAGWKSNPLTDGSLEGYRVIQIDFDKLVTLACEGLGIPAKDVQRTKNFFALGFVFWLYSRDTAREESSIRERFAKRPDLAEANRRAFKAGYYYGETTEAADAPYQIAPARLQPGTYRNVMGSTVLAPRSPADCFDACIEASRIAIEYRTPVILLSDGAIGTGSEPWKLPDLEALPKIDPKLRTDPVGFQPYDRDPETLARQWAVPGTKGLEHRVGGLEKDALTGNVSYDAQNHEKMVRTRAEKVQRVARTYPPTEVAGDPDGDVLVISWGGTYGSVTQALIDARAAGMRGGHVHLRYINPLPLDLLT